MSRVAFAVRLLADCNASEAEGKDTRLRARWSGTGRQSCEEAGSQRSIEGAHVRAVKLPQIRGIMRANQAKNARIRCCVGRNKTLDSPSMIQWVWHGAACVLVPGRVTPPHTPELPFAWSWLPTQTEPRWDSFLTSRCCGKSERIATNQLRFLTDSWYNVKRSRVGASELCSEIEREPRQ